MALEDKTECFIQVSPLSDHTVHLADVSARLVSKIWPSSAAIDEYQRETKLFIKHAELFQPLHVGARSDDGRLIGCALLTALMHDSDVLVASWLMVDPDHRFRGIGRKIMESCKVHARTMGSTLMLTTSSPGFYRNIEFGVETPMPKGRSMFIESVMRYSEVSLEAE